MTTPWRRHPAIYEINTWPWLDALGRRHGRAVTLGDVPPEEWDALRALGFDAIWLMGVWERSPRSREAARAHAGVRQECQRALPDFSIADITGSPYAVRRYAVDPALGGDEGLAAARAALAQRGLKLVLDYVPNHLAVDHPWVALHPDRFVQGTAGDLDEGAWFRVGDRVVAHGRDPFFPAWTDTAQVNAFSAGFRRGAVDTLVEIAARCDGVRCDMAMLLLRDVVRRTWGARVGDAPAVEPWAEILTAVRAVRPGFVFLAEAYWDTEWQLQQLGFDYCYDKRLHERILEQDAEGLRAHLGGSLQFQSGLVRFAENHDEVRVAAALDRQWQRLAAVFVTTLPGARLLHDGQLTGARQKLPVQLGRRVDEPSDEDLRAFYRALLREVAHDVYHEGEWAPCATPHDGRHLMGWTWRLGAERRLVVANPTRRRASGFVTLDDLDGDVVVLDDPLDATRIVHPAQTVRSTGLFVDLPPAGCHLFRVIVGR